MRPPAAPAPLRHYRGAAGGAGHDGSVAELAKRDSDQLLRQAEADLQALLNRMGLGAAAGPEARDRPRPGPGVEAPAAGGAAVPRPTPAAPRAKPAQPLARVAQRYALGATLVALLALFTVVMVSIVHTDRLDKHAGQLDRNEKATAELDARGRSHDAELARRLETLQRALAEVKYPPAAFGAAQELFKAERYAQAETAYMAFLLRYPDSRVADVALHNAAIAAAMRHSCGMAAAYMQRLAARFPSSPLRTQGRELVPECHKLRALGSN
ncbi:hypothetical protein C7C56_012380 [Massilia glaciei]|uniref:Outer membrane lipoprotein BamD-like domain-containing protein n=2 Tax=Massilia glaciei TaxID=1524097 RepID=A0A2U2HLE7_9BURK|nr:hypothetical protein C7C56_012380 [Massilia glaciei]